MNTITRRLARLADTLHITSTGNPKDSGVVFVSVLRGLPSKEAAFERATAERARRVYFVPVGEAAIDEVDLTFEGRVGVDALICFEGGPEPSGQQLEKLAALERPELGAAGFGPGVGGYDPRADLWRVWMPGLTAADLPG
jgi:hypothetical protein